MIGPFLLFLGLFLLWIASQNKSGNLLDALGFNQMISKEETSLGQKLTKWAQNNIWTPLQNAIASGLPHLPNVSVPPPGSGPHPGQNPPQGNGG